MNSKILRSIVAASVLMIFLAGFSSHSEESRFSLKAGITPEEFIQNIRYLASDALRGRGNGTPEMEEAAGMLRDNFRAAGLSPLGDDFFQAFEVQTGNEFGPGNNALIKAGADVFEFEMSKVFVPVSYGTSNADDMNVVFAGYGISAPEKNYDDYKGVDVKGKIVLLLDLEPQRDVKDSVFDGTADTQYAQLQNKILTARAKGAVGAIVTTGPINVPDGNYSLPKVGPGYVVQKMGIPVVRARFDLLQPALKAMNLDLKSIQEEIDKDLKPRSKDIAEVTATVQIDVKPIMKMVNNVVGFLPGSDPALKDEYVVVGAHYDHIGEGYTASMKPSRAGEIHNGADDNASGTSGLQEIAEYFGLSDIRPKRSLLFIAFAGEEMGLLGSAHFLANPLVAKEKMVAMINMDMIGRVKANSLTVGGVGTADDFKGIVNSLNEGFKFDLTVQESGFASSDNASFTAHKIPAVFFFTGTHTEYHSPDDDWNLINVDDGVRVAQFAAMTTQRIANLDKTPVFKGSLVPQVRPGRGGDRPWFGSMPDFSYKGEGYKFQAVSPESPAGKAGLKSGDILIELGGKKITNIYDFTGALGAYKPGDDVEVKVLRDGEVVTAVLHLTRRQ